MNKFLTCTAVVTTVLMVACGDGQANAAKQIAAAADSIKAAANIDLAANQLPLTVQMPLGLPAPTLVWKDEIGKLSLTSGDHFALEIYEAPPDMDRLKADLDRDLLKKNIIIQESPDLLVYRSEFPDDSTLIYFHFHQLINSGGRSFIVEDADDGHTFSQEDIQRMAKAVQAKNPA